MPNSQPNVLVLCTDQQRWDTLGIYGNPMALTPNLDHLAQRGVRFEHAFTPQPVCGPARAALQTGLYASATGIWKNYAAPLNKPTLATGFRRAGYDTAYVGKWHLAGSRENPVPPTLRGDYEFWEAADALEHTSGPFSGHIFDTGNHPLEFTGYRADFLEERAEHFLRRPRTRPFLLFVGFLEPHQQNDLGRYVAPPGYEVDLADCYVPPDVAWLSGDWKDVLPSYYGQVKRLDELTGRLMATLEQRGLLENTIIVMTSDHGNHFRTRNAEYKRSGHDASIRIPLLMAGPGVPEGRVVSDLVSLVDVAPTLWDLANVSAPGPIHGSSLRTWWAEGFAAGHQPDRVFIQVSGEECARFVRTRRYKYGVVAEGVDGRKTGASDRYREHYLYDLWCDPQERVNLATDPALRSVRRDLREVLRSLMAQAGEGPVHIEEIDPLGED